MENYILKEFLQKKYESPEAFLENVIFPVFGEENYDSAGNYHWLRRHPEDQKAADNAGILDILVLGSIYVEGSQLDVFDVTVASKHQLANNRVGIQQLVRRIISTHSGAFIVFHYKTSDRWDWRFTFCHKGASMDDSTDAKRYTFLLGPGQSCRTAAENFGKLRDKISSSGTVEMSDIVKAFDVEALSEEFFDKYKAQYEKFVAYMANPANGMREDFIDTDFEHEGLTDEEIRIREEKPLRDYVKKLLGRIVFLYFIQKKGWLGVEPGKDWGDGDMEFMLHLFEKASEEQKANFLDKVLEPLFEGGLNTDRSSDDYLFDTGIKRLPNNGVLKVPYLNGGLFERDASDEPESVFPAEYFGSLLEFLSQYNFTIDENDPNDAQVGIDPEMLGRIFENLLEDNKDKGTYYTHKDIVQYMCKEALISFLQKGRKEEDCAAIRDFVVSYNVEQLPTGIISYVDSKLKAVKICDPAIGSGAFPMVLLKEIFFCRGAIENFADSAKIKKEIIQNNIYGVDIEKGAVDIARLRFWLSIVVDEDKPSPLPNLDYKIMQGNSLCEEYKGVDLSHLLEEQTYNDGTFDGTFFQDVIEDLREELSTSLREYFSCTEQENKIVIKEDIKTAILAQLSVKGYPKDLVEVDMAGNNQFFLWHTWFYDVFEKGGFDIVIGNPPWGADLSKSDKAILKRTFQEIDSSTPNSFAYFIGWANRYSKDVVSLVLPDSILIKDYAKTRRLICDRISEIIWFQNCGVPDTIKKFIGVDHDVCIISFDREIKDRIDLTTESYIDGVIVKDHANRLKAEVIRPEFDYVFNLRASDADISILNKMTSGHDSLDSFMQCHEGIHTGNVRDKLFINGYKPGLKPLYYGGSAGDVIKTYSSQLSCWFVDYRKEIIDKSRGEYASLRDERIFNRPKIYVTRTGNPFKAFFDESSYASNNFFSLQYLDYSENTAGNLLFVLPFINSRICQYFIRTFAAPRLGNTFVETKIIHLLKFPVPKPNADEKERLHSLVLGIINQRQDDINRDTKPAEEEINLLIYHLYGLNYDEVKVIEPDISISREEYESNIRI